MNKKILLVYPHNFLERKMGVDSRFYGLITYFKTRNIEVDLFALKNFVSSWDKQDLQEKGLIDELFFYDFAEGRRQGKRKGKKWPLRFLKQKVSGDVKFAELPDYAFDGMKKKFLQILAAKQYDFVIISYVYWAGLIEPRPAKNCRIILDLSDFTTLNLFDMTAGKIDTGVLLGEEIRRVNLFDDVLCISAEEQWFFSQFAKNPYYYYIPFFLKKGSLDKKNPKNDKDKYESKDKDKNKKYDLLFVGSDNPFNKEGIDWFLKEVFPLLSAPLNILVVGKVTAHVREQGYETGNSGSTGNKNVKCIPFAADLGDVYRQTKIALCPLLGGTGIKIKVIEALAYELPVVTTPKGVTGFPSKAGNGCLVADTPQEFADQVSRLLSDGNFYNEQSRQARQYFREHFEESRVYKQLDHIFLSPGEIRRSREKGE
ncbi:MAG: glycosyltransferase family 4 protein [Candidatus Aminicenantes bacterium]|nr:glycosyltransferase family 4 protein [Candidatus Aminicenantes bacterium]